MIPALRFEMARRPWALLLCLALGACADGPAPIAASEPLFSDASFAPPSERIVAADIFKVSPDMRAYLDSRVAEEVAQHGEARGLVEALFKDRRLQLDYDAEYTRNAAQAFDARAGNCLSLAIVTGAMAKELGLQVRYHSVTTSEHWERDGDLLELVGHVNVSVGMPVPKVRTWGFNTDSWTVDFLSPSDMKGPGHPSDFRIPHRSDVPEQPGRRGLGAQAHGRRVLVDQKRRRIEPSFSSLYNTLGIIYFRKGMLARAESALHFALSLEPDNSETWNNLALVLRHGGHAEQAAAIERQHPSSGAATLAAAIDGGMKANESGDYARALELFKRALRTSSDNHELHYLLAVTYLNLGDRRLAMEHLLKAEDDSTTARQRSIYASKVELLKSTTSSFRLDPKVLQSN